MSDTSDTNDTDNEKSGAESKTLTLSLKRTVDAGHVRQNFSRGRSKSVVVEKKKRRIISGPSVAETPAAPEPEPEKAVKANAPVAKKRPAPKAKNADGSLSAGEKDARLRALAAARERDAEDKIRQEAEAKLGAERKKAAEVERLRLEAEEKLKPKLEPEAEVDAPATNVAKPAAKVAAAASGARAATARPRPASATPAIPLEPGSAEREQRKVEPRKRPGAVVKPDTSKRTAPARRHKGRLTIANALDERQRERSLASLRRKRERQKAKNAGPQAPATKSLAKSLCQRRLLFRSLATGWQSAPSTSSNI